MPLFHRRISVQRLAIALLAALGPSLSQAANFQDIKYADVVKYPAAAKRNSALRTYLMGIALVIKLDYQCRQSDRTILEDPDKIIDEMTAFSKTTWGNLYLENTAGPGGVSWSSTQA